MSSIKVAKSFQGQISNPTAGEGLVGYLAVLVGGLAADVWFRILFIPSALL